MNNVKSILPSDKEVTFVPRQPETVSFFFYVLACWNLWICFHLDNINYPAHNMLASHITNKESSKSL
jgi:hypothetical protein